MKKLAIVTTHPIQYNAPWFRLLAERKHVQIKVFYTWSQASETVEDRTFGQQIKWDIPLLEGYDYEFVNNIAKDPGVHHFFGINTPDLIASISTFQPNAVLVFGWNFKSHFATMRHFHGKIPVWFRGDSTLLDEVGGFKTLLRRTILKFIYRYIDKALYVGKANKAYFLKHGLKPSQLIYAPHAIDNERFSDSQTKSYELQATTWREDLGYASNDIVVNYAGKFEPVKQLDLLIDIFNELHEQRNIQFKLLLIGNGPLEAQLKERSSHNPNIQFLPFQNQSKMPLVYRLGNLFCLPSRSETWGLAINEAMACGTPVLVNSNVGCAQDIVGQNQTGFVFDSKDGFLKILENNSISSLQTLGKKAEQAIKTWSFNAIVEPIENNL